MPTKPQAKPDFIRGEVVFVKGDSCEYQVVKKVTPDEIITFNPRWGGIERTARKYVRHLTAKEKGDL